MCAIIGWAGKIKNPILRGLVKNAEPRGPHSIGLVFDEAAHPLSNSSGLNSFKRAVTPSFFLNRHYRRVRRAAAYGLGFAHVRWATHGDVIDSNAHPFYHTTADGRTITFCHNGVISNYLEFKPDAIVDSECFGPLLEAKEPAKAHGSCGLCWFETDASKAAKMFVYRRSQNLSAFTFGENGDVFTLVVSVRNIIPSELFLLPHFESKLAEGVAYQVKPGGLARAWDDLHVSPNYQTWSPKKPRRYYGAYHGGSGLAASGDGDEDTAGAEPCGAPAPAGDAAAVAPAGYCGG